VLESIVTEVEQDQRKQMELERRVLEEEAEQIRQELLTGLEDAARSQADPAQRLFAEDTARGLKLLEVLSRRYDVVVMNPPYGAFVPEVMNFIKAAYPLAYSGIDAAFVMRGTELTYGDGYVGALVPRNFVAKTRKGMEEFRTHLLLKSNPLMLMLDLGSGILDDATVEAAAIVLKGGRS
jgi:hypothetical protein